MKTINYTSLISLFILLILLFNPLKAQDKETPHKDPEFFHTYPYSTCNCIEQKIDGTNNGCSVGTVDVTCGYCEGWGCYPGEDNWRSACNTKYGTPEYGWYIPPGSASNKYHQPNGCSGFMCGKMKYPERGCPANGESAPPCPPAPNS